MSESEQLMVVDEAGHPLYTATRQDVHTQGLWHETFHCFVIDSIKQQVVLQQRADQKKDFPGMLDITAAGHLLAGESVADGVRELEEEIGLVKSFEELYGLGVYQEELLLPGFIDRERIHLFLTDSVKTTERLFVADDGSPPAPCFFVHGVRSVGGRRNDGLNNGRR